MAITRDRKLRRDSRDVPCGVAAVEVFRESVGNITGHTDCKEVGKTIGELELEALTVHVAEREIIGVEVRVRRGDANLGIVDRGQKIAGFFVLAISQTDQPSQAIRDTWLPAVKESRGCRRRGQKAKRTEKRPVILVEAIVPESVIGKIPVQAECFAEQIIGDVAGREHNK